MDTLVAIIAGLMLFSLVLGGTSAEGERGFGLLFVSLPVTLAQLPYSQVVISAVFLLVVMIVWATAISLLEPVIAWFREWTGSPRGWSAVIVGAAVWLAGLGTLFSFNLWSEYRFAGATIYRWLELTTGGVLIPAVAVLFATFAGWCLTRRYSASILGNAPVVFRKVWFWVMRLVLPVLIAWIGIQYTVFSLSNLCENGSAAIWCNQNEVAAEQPADVSGTISESVPENGEQQPRSNESETSRQGHGNDPVENTPNDDDILYHSV